MILDIALWYDESTNPPQVVVWAGLIYSEGSVHLTKWGLMIVVMMKMGPMGWRESRFCCSWLRWILAGDVFFLYSWGFDEHEHWCSCEITALLLCPYGFVNKVYPTVIAVSIGLLMILMIKQWIEGYIISRQTHRVDNILISKKHVFKLWFTFGQS